MGILGRTREIIASNVNALLDRAENPAKLVSMMVREMEDTLVELKATCAGSMATRRRVQREMDDVRVQTAGWGERARMAVERGREDLAREALLEKRRYQQRVDALREELTECDHVVGQYQAEIAQVEDKLKSVREKQRVLCERHQHAMQKRRTQEQIRRIDTSDALMRFNEFEFRLDRMEAEADLVNFGRSRSLDERFRDLEQDSTIEQELEELRRAVTAG